MSYTIPIDILKVESTSGNYDGNLSNILKWDETSFWMSENETFPYFTINSIIPLFIHQVDFMSRGYACAYPSEWKFEGKRANGEIVTLLQEKPGLCENNFYEDEYGKLCNSSTISSYKINNRFSYISFTFTSLMRSHKYPSTFLDIASVRMFGDFHPMESVFCTHSNFRFSFFCVLFIF